MHTVSTRLIKSLDLLLIESPVTDEAVIEIWTRKLEMLYIMWNHSFKTLNMQNKLLKRRQAKTKGANIPLPPEWPGLKSRLT